jgi:hypothetical protein
MKISNNRVSQHISPYDQSRIDAAKQKSDSRVVSRAIADKAREESIKAHVDFEKMKLVKEQLEIEYKQTIAAAELVRVNNEQAHINNKTLALTHEKDILDAERLMLNKEVAHLDLEKVKTLQNIAQLSVEQSQLEAEKSKQNAIKEHSIYITSTKEAEKARLDFEKIKLENETAKALVLQTTLEHAKTQEYTEQVRLNTEIAKAEADKAKLFKETSIIQANKEKDILIKTQIETTKLRIASEKAQADTDKANYIAEKARLDYNKARLEAEKSRFDTNKSRFDAKIAHNKIVSTQLQIKQEETKRAQFDAEIAQSASNKAMALANTVKDNAIIIYSHLELERIDVEKSRLDVEKSRLDLEQAHVNNAPATVAKAKAMADKSQSDALISVQRLKIMKTLQILSIKSCKRVDELYFTKSVISITNIYQKTYNNNKCATGFGDFIRGCYFVLDFCEMFHFQPNIVINHPLYEFLENSYITHNSGEVEIVSMFEDNNWNKHILNRDNIIINTTRKNETMSKFVHYLCSSPIDNNNINIYNILFPYFDISAEHKKVMCDILKPTQEMKEYVDYTLAKFELTENNYICIHIRSGDNYLNCMDKQFNSTYLNHITNDIITLLNKYPTTCFLLIADNNFIKFYLSSKKLHRLYIIFNEIGHLGENTQLERNQVKNTMLDFYLFAYSSNIYAFSSYDHGSGFSFWCAKTYGIPYSCKIIKH